MKRAQGLKVVMGGGEKVPRRRTSEETQPILCAKSQSGGATTQLMHSSLVFANPAVQKCQQIGASLFFCTDVSCFCTDFPGFAHKHTACFGGGSTCFPISHCGNKQSESRAGVEHNSPEMAGSLSCFALSALAC